MGITYKQIEEMIETGDTEEKAKEIIIKKYKASAHKREPVPKYEFDRTNHLMEME